MAKLVNFLEKPYTCSCGMSASLPKNRYSFFVTRADRALYKHDKCNAMDEATAIQAPETQGILWIATAAKAASR
jgi:hypothetical protein